jgi:signal transduction histidine kinase
VVVPAVAHDKFLGFFEIWNSGEKQNYPDRALQLLVAIGAQAASALENLTLLMQSQQAEAELNARLAEQTFLYEMGRALEQSQEIRALPEIASRYFADYLQATSVYYFKHLAELERFELEFEFFTERANPQERQTAVGQSWPLGEFHRYYRAVESKWPQVQTRVDADLTPTERYVFEHRNGQTIVLIPMTLKDHYYGYFEIWDSTAVKSYDEHTLQILLTSATQVAFKFENVRLVNELKQAAERARELATAADSANRLKTEIIANISHELRTPLTAIQGSLSLIIQDTASPRADAAYWLNVAYEGSERLLKLINALLSVAKIEAHQIQLVHTAVDVPLLMREVEGHIRPLADEKGLSVQLNIVEITDWLWLDYEHVRQILLSLLQNAVKFTEDGQIKFAARREGEEIVFMVSDTGIGLTPEIQEQLFRPFGQADGSSTRRYGGFGMGLYTSQRLAELMEGRLQVYSAGQGLGTTVTLRLPWRLAEVELSLAISH